MSEPSQSAADAARESASGLSQTGPVETPPSRVFLVPYPKVVFLYPVFLVSIIAALYMSVSAAPAGPIPGGEALVSALFLLILAVNLVILAFDFPRTTSLTLFFFVVAVVTGCVLLFTLKPEILPPITHMLAAFRPVANATFFWSFAGILGMMFFGVTISSRFDYWEVRPNELLHHHGFLSNLERFSAPNLRIDKEINDVFEYMLLRSGRLILQASNERRAIILDNVPFIKKKEDAITRMLGALQVQVRSDSSTQ
jgi:hypothetical protein